MTFKCVMYLHMEKKNKIQYQTYFFLRSLTLQTPHNINLFLNV